jgi:hypothetical protein
VRVENGSHPFEQVKYVPSGEAVEVSYPVFLSQPLSSSAGVVSGSSSLHEYTLPYTRELSRTEANVKLGTGARLVVLASRPDESQRSPIKFRSIRLLDENGKFLADLAQSSVAEGSTPGLSAAFAAEINAGGIVIEWKNQSTKAAFCWRQPLWLPEGYVMLVFLSVPPRSAVPRMASASIHLARREEGFEPRASSASATERALDSLRTGRQLLSYTRVKQDLLEEKFQNPMLGIYGAHMILQRTMPDEDKARILKEVLENLEKLVPGSPDVAALKLMSSRLGERSRVPPCTWPPMIRLGYVAYRDADYEQPGAFIEGSSVADRVRTALASGGVWTRWNAERGSVAEFPNATPAAIRKTISKRLAQAAKVTGLPLPSAKVQEFSSAIADAGFTLGKHVLSVLAPTLLGGAAEGEVREAQGSIERVLSSLAAEHPPTSEAELSMGQDAFQNLSWTGLNKNQIKDLARSVLKSRATDFAA